MKKETKWLIDQAHTTIEFKVRHLMIAYVKGSFKTFDASIYTSAKDFTTAEIDLWIDATSVTTGNAERDEHIKGPDFFDVENHKQITFTSSTIEKADADGNQILWGELTLKGITKNLRLEVQFGGIVKDPWGNERAGLTVAAKINRSEWGLVWNTFLDAGGVMLGEEISISCEVELINASDKTLKMELEPAINETVDL